MSAGFPTLQVKAGESGSLCNLTTQNLINFVEFDQNNQPYLNRQELESSTRLIARIGVRQTCVNIPMPGWNETQLEERLLGVSATGWQDTFDLLGWDYNSPEASRLRKYMRFWANDEATKYSERLGVPRPLLVTTIKPEGTASTVYGCSWGVHNNWSPYYIRRMRITSKDALSKVLLAQGYPCYPEIYDLEKLVKYYSGDKEFLKLDAWERLELFDQLSDEAKREILDSCNTVVFEFPIQSSAKKTQAEVSAIDQLENTKLFTQEYTDHMPSSTISVKEHEWNQVIDWLYENWTTGFITASFLAFYDSQYPLLPYEAISKEQYEERLKKIPERLKTEYAPGKFYFTVDMELLAQEEKKLDDPDDVELDSACSQGTCPSR